MVQMVIAELLERKVAGSIPAITDFHTVRVEGSLASLATDAG